MNAKLAAQVIRNVVGMDQILNIYGYKQKHGFVCCPFHGEKKPSMKIYDKPGGWHCFGCGRGGSVIDFVMEHEGCDFKTAVSAIDKFFNLHIDDKPIDALKRTLFQQKLDEFVEAVYAYCDEMIKSIDIEMASDVRRLQIINEKRELGDIQTITADDWTFWLTWNEIDQYNEYRKEKIEEFKEEVASWRRRQRKVL